MQLALAPPHPRRSPPWRSACVGLNVSWVNWLLGVCWGCWELVRCVGLARLCVLEQLVPE
eukprot:15455531-Alexandrium_andersonii.AAC.1